MKIAQMSGYRKTNFYFGPSSSVGLNFMFIVFCLTDYYHYSCLLVRFLLGLWLDSVTQLGRFIRGDCWILCQYCAVFGTPVTLTGLVLLSCGLEDLEPALNNDWSWSELWALIVS